MSKDQPVVTVVTATKLSSAQHKLLRQLVEQKMGKSVQIQEHIDPDLIGGITIKIGDQVFDSSIAGQLSKLESLVPKVSIVTAYPLSSTAKLRLQTEVQTSLGSSVEVTLSVDPTILGGFKIKFNSREYDSTLRTKIQKLRTQLLQTKLA